MYILVKEERLHEWVIMTSKGVVLSRRRWNTANEARNWGNIFMSSWPTYYPINIYPLLNEENTIVMTSPHT